MTTPLRRQDRKSEDNEAYTLLKKGEYGILSMCSTENTGYGIPLSYVLVDNCIYFHCATEGSKLENIRKNDKVSFCVVGKTEVMPSKFGTLYESVIATGQIMEIEGAEKQEGLEYFLEKYSKDYIPEGIEYISKLLHRVKVLKLTIDSVSGKARKQ